MPDEMTLIRMARERQLKAEQEVARMRGCLRGARYKIDQGCWQTVRDIIEHCLKKSLAYYPYPIEGEPTNPLEVKK